MGILYVLKPFCFTHLYAHSGQWYSPFQRAACAACRSLSMTPCLSSALLVGVFAAGNTFGFGAALATAGLFRTPPCSSLMCRVGWAEARKDFLQFGHSHVCAPSRKVPSGRASCTCLLSSPCPLRGCPHYGQLITSISLRSRCLSMCSVNCFLLEKVSSHPGWVQCTLPLGKPS